MNRSRDVRLYGAPNNPPNTGTRYTSGTDLYVHRSTSGSDFFYLYHWSLWEGSEESTRLISSSDAYDLLVDLAGEAGVAAISSEDDRRILEYFPDIYVETA